MGAGHESTERTPDSKPDRVATNVGAAARRVMVASGVSNGALGVLAFVTARALGPDGRGVLVLFVTLCSFMMLVGSVGVNISGRVHLVSRDDPVSGSDYVGLCTALVVVQATLTALVARAVLPVAHARIGVTSTGLLGGYGGALLTASLFRDGLYAFGFSVRAAATEAGGSLLQLALVVAVLSAGNHGVQANFAAMTSGAVVQAIVTVAVFMRSSGVRNLSWSRRGWALLIRRGIPGVAITLGQATTFRLDRYLTGVFLSAAAVGVYSVSATATEVLWLAPVALAQVLFHRLASGASSFEELAAVRRRWLVAMVAGAAAIYVVAPAAVRVLLGARYAGAVTPLRILLVGAIAVASYHIDNLALAAVGHIASAGFAAVTGLVLVAAGDVVLIPRYGIEGAAWASVFAYAAMAALSRAMLRSAIKKAKPPRRAPAG